MHIRVLLLSLIFLPGLVAAEEPEAAQPALEYLEMTPKFTVNLQERRKYLMVDIQLLVEGESQIETVKKHFPALRHEVIMLLSGRPMKELQSAEPREKLRQEALGKIRETLVKYADNDTIKDLFFTEFLIQ